MNLDLPVFDRKPLWKNYYIFMGTVVVIAIASFFITGLVDVSSVGLYLNSQGTLVFLGVFLLISFFISKQRKKDLQAMHQTEDVNQKISMYALFYRKRLFANIFSVVLMAGFWVLTIKNFYFYMLLIQVLISAIYFPNKKVIARELNEPEIEFV